MNEDSKTYDLEILKKEADPRFQKAKKEMIQIHVQYFMFVFIEFLTAYVIYKVYPNTYIFGFPLWLVLGIMITIAFLILTVSFMMHGISDCSLDAKEKGEDHERN